jgi:uncharacterized OB-fold protein
MSVAKSWREMPHRYRLEAGKCKKCGAVLFPKRLICPECGHREFEMIRLQREGTLLTYTIIHVGPKKFGDQTPYAIGIVELKEGVRLLSQIVDCDHSKIKIGMPLKIEFRRISAEGEAGIINYGYKCVPA